MRTMVPWLLGCTTACLVGTAQIEETTFDSATPAPSGTTLATGSTSETTLYDWFIPGQLEVAGDVLVPDGEVTVVSIHFDSPVGVHGDVISQRSIGSVTVDSNTPFELGMPSIPDDTMFSEDPNYPGLDLALFYLGAYIDLDGDGEAGPYDSYLASDIHFFAYLRGELPLELAAMGAELGWNRVSIEDVFTGESTIEPIDGTEDPWTLNANLLPEPGQAGLGCLVIPELSDGPPGTRRVDLISSIAFMGLPGPDSPTMLSELVSDGIPNQFFQFDDPPTVPPEDHLWLDFSKGPPAAAIAPYFGVAYIDADNNGSWNSLTEIPLATSYELPEEQQHQILYIEARHWSAVWLELWLGMGWQVYQNPPEGYEDLPPTLIPWSEGLVLDAISDTAGGTTP